MKIVSDCPNCGHRAGRDTYDIGSGPELSCAWCEFCWGADGQELKPMVPPEIKIIDGHPIPMWWHPDGKLHAEPPPVPEETDMAGLIEQSSLGAPDAKEMRAGTPPETVQRIVEGSELIAFIEAATGGTPVADLLDPTLQLVAARGVAVERELRLLRSAYADLLGRAAKVSPPGDATSTGGE